MRLDKIGTFSNGQRIFNEHPKIYLVLSILFPIFTESIFHHKISIYVIS